MSADSDNQLVNGSSELRFGNEAIHQAQLQRALGIYRLTGQDQLERRLWSNQKRQNRGSKRRKNANRDFGLREAGFWRGNHQVTERRELRAPADCGAIHYANDRLADFQHSRERSVKGIQHLEDPL